VALLELLQQFRKEIQQQQQQDEDDPSRQESGVLPLLEGYQNLQIPMAVQTKLFRNQDRATKDGTKRGSCKYRKTYTIVLSSCSHSGEYEDCCPLYGLVERYQCYGEHMLSASSG
jgi:pentatricopeptide repeat protein